MPKLPLLFATWLLGAIAGAQDPVELSSRIDQVTVYPSAARVERLTDPVPGSGEYVLRGLPDTLDEESVRVRCRGGYVVGVEVRERVEDRTPEARVQELRDALLAAGRGLEALRDELGVAEQLRTHLRGLLEREARAEEEEVVGGRVSTEQWALRHQFVVDRLRENVTERRNLAWAIEDEEARLRTLERELGEVRQGTSVSLRDVYVKVVTGPGGGRLEVEHLSRGASWRPVYDLRADVSGKRVRVVYRGEVSQRTGEDWNQVKLLLSSAEPERSARGPDLEGRWVWLFDPRAPSGAALRSSDSYAPAEKELTANLETLGYASGDDHDESPFAAVQDEGLSVRFAVPGRDSVETAGGARTVLIGEAAFAVRPEYYCVPSIDTTVWLRGHATNDSEWPILPGLASVYFGEDYLGKARLETVELGQEFVVPLGATDAIGCERVQTTDRSKGPSLFGSQRKEVEGWRYTFSNHGGQVCEPDGSVKILVREAIPKPTDSKIEVELAGLSHQRARGEEWDKDQEELGIHTWIVQVPRQGQVDLRFQIAVSHPKDRAVTYR